jgi:hypothetical protein
MKSGFLFSNYRGGGLASLMPLLVKLKTNHIASLYL